MKKKSARSLRLLFAAALFAATVAPFSLNAADLSSRVAVDTRLPAYLNKDQARLIFVRHSVDDIISLELSFRERVSGYVPAAPFSIKIDGPGLRHEEVIDIADWPDGEYKVFLHDLDSDAQPLVRAIRKQTQIPPKAPAGPIDISSKKLFFVDDWYLDYESGVQRSVQPAELLPVDSWHVEPELQFKNPSIRQFWKADDGYFYVNISAINYAGEHPKQFWLRSPDMKNWQRTDTHQPATASWRVHHLRAQEPVARDTGAIPPNPQYRLYDPERDGPVNLSEVVVRYTGLERNVRWGGVPVPFRARVPLWVRPNGEALILGSITEDRWAWPENEIGEWRDSNDNFGIPKFTKDGSALRVFQTRMIPRHDPFRVYYDNNLADRIMVTWTTHDGLNWEPTYFSVPTEQDPWSTQHYGVDSWWEENNQLELAYLRIYDNQRQRLYVELAYSRDGIYWNRFADGGILFDNGPRGSWNFGYSITPPTRLGTMIRHEYDGHYYERMYGINVLHFMFLMAHNRRNRDTEITFDGFATRFGGRMMGERGVENSAIMQWYEDWHDIVRHTREQRSVPALARFRKDGWVALEPLKRRGEVISKPVLLGQALAINAQTREDGFIKIELLDDAFNPLPEFSAGNAASFSGDSTNHELSWPAGELSALSGTPVRLRILVDNAKIFTLNAIQK